MNINDLLSHFKDPDELGKIIDDVKSSQDKNDLFNLIFQASEKIALPERIYIQTLQDNFNEKLLQRALLDYPSSLNLILMKLEHSEDKLKVIKDAITQIGTFSPEIWDKYREISPDNSDEIFKQELSCLIIDRDVIEMENMDLDVELNEDSQKIIDLLQIYHFDFTKISTAIAFVRDFPSITNFEWCLNYHPYNQTIWQSYLTIYPNDKNISDRSIRFCFKSGRIWAMRLLFDQNIDFNNYKYIDNALDGRILIGKLCSLDPENTEFYVNNILKLKVFQETDCFVTACIILDEYYIANNKKSERRNILFNLTEKFPQRSDLWLRRIEFERNFEPNIENVRKIYENAFRILQNDKSRLIDSWMAFEAERGNDFDRILLCLTELEAEKELNSKKNEISEDHDNKTVFVTGYDSNTTTRDDLFNFLSEFGEIKRLTMKNKFSFCEYAKIEDADNAIKNCQNKLFNDAKVSISPHVNKEKHTLYIRYDPKSDIQNLVNFLKQKSGVNNITYRFAKNNKDEINDSGLEKRGWGFLDVNSETDANKLLLMNGKLFNNFALRVEIAKHNKKEAFDIKKSKPPKIPQPAPKVYNKEKNDEEAKKLFGF